MTVQELYQKIEGDYQAALKIMMMESLVARMIPRFLDDSSCRRLLDAGAAMDGQEIFESAHALKGTAASLGLVKLSGIAAEICEEYRPGHTRSWTEEALKARLAELSALYDKTIDGIRAFRDGQG